MTNIRKFGSDNSRLFFLLIIGCFFCHHLMGYTQQTMYTFIYSEGIGKIAVRIEYPKNPRYPDGAPIVVEVSTWFVSFNEFHRVNDTRQIGAVTISYLWPGRQDLESGLASEGTYDYGGPHSLAALKDVIRFGSGLIPDTAGSTITELSPVPLLLNNVGLFASSHAGVVATNVLAYFGEEIPSVKYLVGRENPTRDEMYPLEIGYFDGASAEMNKVTNPFFDEESYLPDSLIVDYSTVGWYLPPGEEVGRPYFTAKDTLPQHILAHDKTPHVDNKQYYSRNLTRALLENGALDLANWPEYLGTPGETESFWPYRITVHNYPSIGNKLPHIKVMLVFSRYDHVQAAKTKPHIHQAWDGFYHGAGLWVRMNPDRAYVQSIDPGYGSAFPDNLANKEPNNWDYIEDWGFPPDHRIREEVWLASVAEMADRLYTNNWDNNLDSVFIPVLIDQEETSVHTGSSKKLIPKVCNLLPNFPNPFNPKTTIPIYLVHYDEVRLMIYNLKGELVENLFNGSISSGYHAFQWQATDLPNGVYFAQFQFSQGLKMRKLLLIK